MKSDTEKLADAYKALDAIEKITSDEFCEALEWKSVRKRNSEEVEACAKKLTTIYLIAHSESPNHICHSVHASWRKLKDEVLK